MEWHWGKPAVVVTALLAIVLTSAPAPAAKKKAAAATGGVVGQVVGQSHAKTVSGARVQVAKPKRAKAARRGGKKARRRRAHPAGVVSKAGGHFALSRVRPGTHTITAHKKHVGSGQARVTVTAHGTAQATIRLHQYHHHHSGVVTLSQRARVVTPTVKRAAPAKPAAPAAAPKRKK